MDVEDLHSEDGFVLVNTQRTMKSKRAKLQFICSLYDFFNATEK